MKIEAKHLAWIFETAGEHFTEKVAELEVEIIRHEHWIKSPLIRSNIARKPRAVRLHECIEALETYRELTLFCRDMREIAANRSAAEFAEAFKGQFRI